MTYSRSSSKCRRYRIGCFRDDIVFLIYVYQRWIYKIDPKRVNEFGTTGDGQSVDENDHREVLAVQNGEVPQGEEPEPGLEPEVEPEPTAIHSDSGSGDELLRNRKKDKKIAEKKKKRKRQSKGEEAAKNKGIVGDDEDGEEIEEKRKFKVFVD